MDARQLRANLRSLKRDGQVLVGQPWEAVELVEAAGKRGINAQSKGYNGVWIVWVVTEGGGKLIRKFWRTVAEVCRAIAVYANMQATLIEARE